MEKAMSNFENMVGSAEQKLENIEKKIDAEFSEHLGLKEGNEENRTSLLQKLDEIKTEYSSLCKEAAELSVAQRQMAEAFQQELLTQVRHLQMLQDKGLTGSDRRLDGEAEAAVNRLVQMSNGSQDSLSQSVNESRKINTRLMWPILKLRGRFYDNCKKSTELQTVSTTLDTTVVLVNAEKKLLNIKNEDIGKNCELKREDSAVSESHFETSNQGRQNGLKMKRGKSDKAHEIKTRKQRIKHLESIKKTTSRAGKHKSDEHRQLRLRKLREHMREKRRKWHESDSNQVKNLSRMKTRSNK